MNKTLEKVVVCILGFAIGTVAGGFIAFEMLQKKISEKT